MIWNMRKFLNLQMRHVAHFSTAGTALLARISDKTRTSENILSEDFRISRTQPHVGPEI